jgi:hypothetical protein
MDAIKIGLFMIKELFQWLEVRLIPESYQQARQMMLASAKQHKSS